MCEVGEYIGKSYEEKGTQGHCQNYLYRRKHKYLSQKIENTCGRNGGEACKLDYEPRIGSSIHSIALSGN